MTRVEADIEALKTLREALLIFANRQTETLEAAGHEINRTVNMLDQAEQRWSRSCSGSIG